MDGVRRPARRGGSAWTLLPRVRRPVATHQTLLRLARAVRSDLIRVLAVLRRLHLVLADRFVERGWLDDRDDYFLLHLPEIGAVIDGSAPPNVCADRRERRAEQDGIAQCGCRC